MMITLPPSGPATKRCGTPRDTQDVARRAGNDLVTAVEGVAAFQNHERFGAAGMNVKGGPPAGKVLGAEDAVITTAVFGQREDRHGGSVEVEGYVALGDHECTLPSLPTTTQPPRGRGVSQTSASGSARAAATSPRSDPA